MLAHHPHEQAKLQREADEIVKGPCASLEETQKLTDTLCALYESIRMYVAAPYITARHDVLSIMHMFILRTVMA